MSVGQCHFVDDGDDEDTEEAEEAEEAEEEAAAAAAADGRGWQDARSQRLRRRSYSTDAPKPSGHTSRAMSKHTGIAGVCAINSGGAAYG